MTSSPHALQLAVLFLALAIAGPSLAGPTTIHVSPDGDDSWSGRFAVPTSDRSDGPLATLHRARDVVRRCKRQADSPIDVVLHAGDYALAETLVLTPADAGTPAAPITWKAARGERVTIRGTRTVTKWQPWKRGILRANLAEQGLGGVEFHQLFQATGGQYAQRRVLARHPNFDPEHPWSGGNLYIERNLPQAKHRLAYRKGDLPLDSWSDISQAEVVSTYDRGWKFAITPITQIDRTNRILDVEPVRGTFRKLNRFYVQNVLDALDAPGEWYLDRQRSVLYFMPPGGRLDGEVLVPVLDHLIEVSGSIPYPHGYLNTKYVGPRDEYPVDRTVPNRPVTQIHFEGIDFEGARQDAIRMVGTRNCSVRKCRITNVGNIGVNLGGLTSSFHEVGNPRVTPAEGHLVGAGGGGQILLANHPAVDCRVEGCDVWATGCEGIMLYGSDNRAENNHVHEIGLYAKDAPCINLLGDRNVAFRNTLHDCPRCAIFIKGVDNVAELNDVHHAVRETCDMGAIRFVQRNPFLQGNIVRRNRILATTGYGFKWAEALSFESPYYTWGIYLDDYTCGTTVEGNIVSGTGRGGVMIHGGGQNHVVNNLVVNAGAYQIELAPMPTTREHFQDAFAGNRIERNVLVALGDRRAPIRWTRQVPQKPAFRDNLVWSGDLEPAVLLQGSFGIRDWSEWLSRGMDQGSRVADPRLVEEVVYDSPEETVVSYSLAEDSPAWDLGFQPIPVERIGCYESPTRASWPIQPNWQRPRETPVLFSEPGHSPKGLTIEPFRILGPVDEDFEDHAVGDPPKTGDVADHPRAPLRIAEVKQGGGKCLQFNDAAGLPQTYLPRIYWPFQFEDGSVVFGADFWLDPQQPADFYLDCRQYSNPGGREYLSGPMIRVFGDGRVTVGGKTLTTVPLGTWFRLELAMSLGEGAGEQSDMTIEVRGSEPQRFVVPHAARGFRRLERVVIASLSDRDARFRMDNIHCDRPGD